jgi:hypothetical protein
MCKFTRSSLKQGRKKEPNNHCEKLGHLSFKNLRNCYGGLFMELRVFKKNPVSQRKPE